MSPRRSGCVLSGQERIWSCLTTKPSQKLSIMFLSFILFYLSSLLFSPSNFFPAALFPSLNSATPPIPLFSFFNACNLGPVFRARRRVLLIGPHCGVCNRGSAVRSERAVDIRNTPRSLNGCLWLWPGSPKPPKCGGQKTQKKKKNRGPCVDSCSYQVFSCRGLFSHHLWCFPLLIFSKEPNIFAEGLRIWCHPLLSFCNSIRILCFCWRTITPKEHMLSWVGSLKEVLIHHVNSFSSCVARTATEGQLTLRSIPTTACPHQRASAVWDRRLWLVFFFLFLLEIESNSRATHAPSSPFQEQQSLSP